MSYLGQRDLLLAAAGVVPGWSTIQKFGRAPDCDTDDPTDIWSRARATGGQKLWLPPTQARVHDIVSTDAAGAGARKIRIFGLTSWDALETSEDVELNGLTPVPTANAYVIIHRMFVIDSGVTSPPKGGNVGVISATAQTDGTVTAEIEAVFGQTLMAIYGIPSKQDFYLTQAYASVNRGTGTLANLLLEVIPAPDVNVNATLTGGSVGYANVGTSLWGHTWSPPRRVPGPAIVKVKAIATSNGTDISAAFGGVLIEKGT